MDIPLRREVENRRIELRWMEPAQLVSDRVAYELLDAAEKQGISPILLRRIRAEPELHGTPVALFSSLPETQIDWRTAGADAFLQKVFNVLELPDFVRGLLERRGGGNGG